MIREWSLTQIEEDYKINNFKNLEKIKNPKLNKKPDWWHEQNPLLIPKNEKITLKITEEIVKKENYFSSEKIIFQNQKDDHQM